jgi:hypothetical protein
MNRVHDAKLWAAAPACLAFLLVLQAWRGRRYGKGPHCQIARRPTLPGRVWVQGCRCCPSRMLHRDWLPRAPSTLGGSVGATTAERATPQTPVMAQLAAHLPAIQNGRWLRLPSRVQARTESLRLPREASYKWLQVCCQHALAVILPAKLLLFNVTAAFPPCPTRTTQGT